MPAPVIPGRHLLWEIDQIAPQQPRRKNRGPHPARKPKDKK